MEVLNNYYDFKCFTDDDLIKFYQETRYKPYLEELNYRYINLQYKLSNKYKGIRGAELEDLLQESYLGFYDAVISFKEAGATFITWCYKIVNQRLYAVVNGYSSKTIGNKELNDNCSSLNDLVVGHDDEEERINLIPGTENIEENFLEIEFIKEIHNAIVDSFKVLTLREINIITSLFGLDSEPINILELADILGITDKAISQSKRNAFRKLRHEEQLQELYKQL